MTLVIEVVSAGAARELEKKLAAAGMSYRTVIAKSRKKGLRYVVTVFSGA